MADFKPGSSPPPSSISPTPNYAQILDNLLDGKNNATGALQARFVNEYDPLYDKPFTRSELNTDRYLNEELCQLLEDDRRAQTKHHLRTDKVEKAYMLMMITHNSMMRN